MRMTNEEYARYQKAYGSVTKALRLKAGLSQAALATKTKITITTISKIERGIANPRLTTMDKIATALRTTISRTFHLTEMSLHAETKK